MEVFKDNIKQLDFRNHKFWVELRKKTSLDGRIGDEEAYFWCNEALTLLRTFDKQHQFKIIEGIISTETYRKHRLYINHHMVLGRKYPDGIFIADGTAGQIHRSYTLGYYGYEFAAPRRLRLFYEPAIRNSRTLNDK